MFNRENRNIQQRQKIKKMGGDHIKSPGGNLCYILMEKRFTI